MFYWLFYYKLILVKVSPINALAYNLLTLKINQKNPCTFRKSTSFYACKFLQWSWKMTEEGWGLRDERQRVRTCSLLTLPSTFIKSLVFQDSSLGELIPVKGRSPTDDKWKSDSCNCFLHLWKRHLSSRPSSTSGPPKEMNLAIDLRKCNRTIYKSPVFFLPRSNPENVFHFQNVFQKLLEI